MVCPPTTPDHGWIIMVLAAGAGLGAVVMLLLGYRPVEPPDEPPPSG